MGRKHCGKRRECWFPAFSPFPTMFSKGLLVRIFLSRDCVVESKRIKFGVSFNPHVKAFPKLQILDLQTEKVCDEKAQSSGKGKKTLWEKEKLLVMSGLPFSHSIFERLVLQTHKNKGLFVEELKC